MLRKIFSPKVKRLTRSQFWAAYLIGWLAGFLWTFICYGIAVSEPDHSGNVALFCSVIYYILLVIYSFYIGLKRFHDAGKSTGFFVVCFILSFILIGVFIRLAVYGMKSDGHNYWGRNEELEEYEKNPDIYRR